MTLEEALKIIGDGRQIVNQTVIPKAFRQDPNSTYRNGYHWLFRYELIGEKGILAEALSNAFYHGHRKDPKLPIEVRIYHGQKGMVIRIHDCGTGFNVKKIHDYFVRGKIYFHSSDNGFRRMADKK